MSTIDLRSDTRTVPDVAMRAAMVAAPVGDDSFGDDPTVRALEEHAAVLTGKPAALFTCGGTMSNLLAVLALGEPGALVVTGQDSHLAHYENDGARVLGLAEVVTVPDAPYGELDVAALTEALARSPGRRALVCLENTGNRHGGSALDAAAIRRQADAARASDALVHLDGARLPNAAVALGTSLDVLAHDADTVAVSLCKGLGAPAGSVLCGASAVIERARYLRRMVGGTMHQTGILAAAGLIAISRIAELAADHRRTAQLARTLRAIPGLTVRNVPVPTNMIVISMPAVPAVILVDQLASHGVLGLPLTTHDVRFVVHRDHNDADLRQAAQHCARAVAALVHDDVGPKSDF